LLLSTVAAVNEKHVVALDWDSVVHPLECALVTGIPMYNTFQSPI